MSTFSVGKFVGSLVVTSALGACASSPFRKTLTATAVGTVVGSLYGSSRQEYQNQNAVMYGALGGLIAGASSLILNVDEIDQEKTRAENETLKRKLNEFQKKLEPQIIGEGHSLFNSPLPKEVSQLVQPGEWKRYKLDQWAQDPNQPNIWYRQVEMFEVILPEAK